MDLFRHSTVRPAAVAGVFYPDDPLGLAGEVGEYLDRVQEEDQAPGFPKALIVPHAGYLYSGLVAASAYALLRPARGVVRRVVILGPCHRVPVRGLALPQATAFATPLGRIPLDAEGIAAIRDLPQVVVSAASHAEEHALEVQLPFLQKVLGEFSLVPLVVGDAAPEEVAEVLDRLWGGPETLVVISSDLSHYHAYDRACEIDRATVRAILDFDARISHDQACGATPISGLLLAARRKGLVPRLLDCRNSGDTAGDRRRVVGYASFALDGEGEGPGYGADHGRRLLRIARASIADALGASPTEPIAGEGWLRETRATFVTLMLREELRGCVGALEAQRPLAEDVAANARAAALEDSRFKPLTLDELACTEIEVSLLSTPKTLAFDDHAELLRKLRPGVDGVILEHEGRRGTYLPQVWDDLADPELFIARLKQKAGIPRDADAPRLRVKRYRVLKWREADLLP